MSVEERLDRLEQRLEIVEALVRRLVNTPDRVLPPEARGPSARREPAPTPRGAPAGAPRDPPLREPEPGPRAAAPPPRTPSQTGVRRLAFEEWIGQRGLLAIGVLALILAAGYLLKLSFERGWISPVVRCAGGVAAGAVVGALGWRLLDRYRTYGASLVGAGAAIMYLAVWAAARLYGLLPPTSGIVALALVSLGLAAIAFAVDTEALGTVAALGAFFAPVLLGRDRSHADLLLLYLACMAIALGWVAARKRWRRAAAVVALAYFGLGWTAVGSAGPLGALAYSALGGAAGMYVALREHWRETRFLSFWGGWALLASLGSARLDAHWLMLAAGIVLAAPVWWYALRNPLVVPRSARGRPVEGPAASGWSLGELVAFLVTPLFIGWAVAVAAPDFMRAHPGIAAFVVAALYLATGYGGRLVPFTLVGAAAAAGAVLEHWGGLPAPAILLALALLWAALDHAFDRSDGRWYALATFAAAAVHLLAVDNPRRPWNDAAFTGDYALVLWLAVAVSAALAAGLLRGPSPAAASASAPPAPARPVPDAVHLARAALWLAGGGLLLFGVTGEITRLFRLRGLAPDTAALAGGLAVSAWWLLFAADLVVLGLRRRIRPARLGGLAVAGLAVAKVLLVDLSSLDALYRVASVFTLGLVSLALAYLYHRQARAASAGLRAPIRPTS
ncbi:MAG TPA: DUF2339 domain-containing protein [Gemmatimonadales bacterium]|nr:DUF2339 domain-containing protein [Gemmatimonadales bacterium]